MEEVNINCSKEVILGYIRKLILARSPRRSTGIRVASGFEFSVCFFVLGKFSNIISYDNII